MQPPRLPRGIHPAIGQSLLPWFIRHRRQLPWRTDRTPYRVWVSEAMLQQTQVDTVIPYFQAWMASFPTVQALAEADVQAVLKVWEGLGYYSRARNLHKAAKRVLQEFQGQIPSDPEDLRSLPGIGPYTQAAVLSLAFGQSFAVLDGNVERVLTRLTGWGGNVRDPGVKQTLRGMANRLMGSHPPGMFNEAMMELGALVCTPRQPDCANCPLAGCCRAGKAGTADRFPVKPSKKPVPTVEVGAAVVWREDGRFLVARRLEEGMLGGLWEFPGGKLEHHESLKDCVSRELQEELAIEVEVGDLLMTVRHSYSHFHLSMAVFHCRWTGGTPQALECADFRWVRLKDCAALPFSRADLKVLEELGADRSR